MEERSTRLIFHKNTEVCSCLTLYDWKCLISFWMCWMTFYESFSIKFSAMCVAFHHFIFQCITLFHFSRSRDRGISNKVELTQTFRKDDLKTEQNNRLVEQHSRLIQQVCSSTLHNCQRPNYYLSLCSLSRSWNRFAGRMFQSSEQEKILNKFAHHWLLKWFSTHLVQGCTHSYDEMSQEQSHSAYCASC